LNRVFGVSNKNSKFVDAVANVRHVSPDIALNGVLDDARYKWEAWLAKRKALDSQYSLLAFMEGAAPELAR
jgi:hypothetical protein